MFIVREAAGTLPRLQQSHSGRAASGYVPRSITSCRRCRGEILIFPREGRWAPRRRAAGTKMHLDRTENNVQTVVNTCAGARLEHASFETWTFFFSLGTRMYVFLPLGMFDPLEFSSVIIW